MATLFEQFLAEEFNGDVESVIVDALKEAAKKEKESFEFNRFDVEIDYSKSSVTISDVLDGSIEGTQVVPLEKFLRTIGWSELAGPAIPHQ